MATDPLLLALFGSKMTFALSGLSAEGKATSIQLLRRLVFHGEQHSPAELEIIESRGPGPAQLREPLFDGGAQREIVQISRLRAFSAALHCLVRESSQFSSQR